MHVLSTESFFNTQRINKDSVTRILYGQIEVLNNEFFLLLFSQLNLSVNRFYSSPWLKGYLDTSHVATNFETIRQYGVFVIDFDRSKLSQNEASGKVYYLRTHCALCYFIYYAVTTSCNFFYFM